MAERIRFHLDEHIDPDVAAALRRHGVDVTTTVEAGLRTADDGEQMAFATRERRVVVTDDSDFLRMAAISADHTGVVICRRAGLSLRDVIRGLILIYEVLSPEEMVGRVEFV